MKVSHRELGRFWSAFLEMKTDHELIASGPYLPLDWVRHPMYSVLMIHAIGLGIVAASALVLALGVLRALMFLVRIPGEKAMLIARFGDQYHEYAKDKGTTPSSALVAALERRARLIAPSRRSMPTTTRVGTSS
ncbi:MAG: isoprenylcysteine carboxylmethyltransferase family protein [Terriglobales bacterium]